MKLEAFLRSFFFFSFHSLVSHVNISISCNYFSFKHAKKRETSYPRTAGNILCLTFSFINFEFFCWALPGPENCRLTCCEENLKNLLKYWNFMNFSLSNNSDSGSYWGKSCFRKIFQLIFEWVFIFNSCSNRKTKLFKLFNNKFSGIVNW